jgi:KipI family sensor histidine kinase inhibitor
VTAAFKIVAAGDAAVVLELQNRIDPDINAAAIAVAESIRASAIAGVKDVVPTYRTVAVHFDPLHVDYAGLVERLRRASTQFAGRIAAAVPGRPIRVPVAYGGDYGPDLETVARYAGVTEAEAIEIHASRVYRVFMLGFLPGLAYMGIVDPRIAAPRLPVPRVRVAPGSVGIAGSQTGIYPVSTPGGWQIVGASPLRPFDLRRPEPFLFKAGDAVQFYAIDRAEYARLAKAGD